MASRRPGFGDLFLGYPTLQSGGDCRHLAETIGSASAGAVADAPEHLAALSTARGGPACAFRGHRGGHAYRPLGLAHLGVRRSPLREEGG